MPGIQATYLGDVGPDAASALAMLASKQVERPHKKHDNIPL